MTAERYEEAVALIDAFLREWPETEFGPAHVILSDLNLEDCWFPETRERLAAEGTEDARATLDLLDRLQAIPEDDRCPDDDDADEGEE